MTAPKPPDNKTLVGLPNELKAILERPRLSPPPLPSQRGQTLLPAAPPQQPLQPQASMDRTLIGIPTEMQAALERALAEKAAARARAMPRPQPAASAQVEVPPTASGSVLRVQAVRTLGVSNAPASEAQAPEVSPVPRPRGLPVKRSAPPQRLPPPPDPGRRSSPPKLPTQAAAQRSATSQQPAPATARGQSQLTAQSELLAQSQITAAPFLAPNAPLDWPPAQRRSESGFMPRLSSEAGGPAEAAQGAGAFAGASRNPTARRLSPQPITAEPSVIVEPDEPQPQLDTRIHIDSSRKPAAEQEALPAVKEGLRKPRAFTLPPGSAHAKTSRTKAVVEAPPKRWPAITLIALAVVAFGCVVVLRAPNLLPAPLAALLAPDAKHGHGESSAASVPPASPSSASVAAVPAKPLATDTSAATNPTLTPPSPTRPPASPPFTSGMSAQLEKKAIERLMADDYPAALQAYEKLRSAEPHRPEFSAMVEMLTRVHSPACSQPGQPACAGAAP